ncbi:hypothetical protein FYZ48_09890 [Gimesia chilikensis]|uniref:hypothetical protein n=1 Tax=Gimesia chilikensis TaxID=2605989 RepID=UPI0011F09AC9|nr:hypothetical protein [Gimesia chilikensis]KAA0138962.1 hypothetical protein FYZ48_09890 [Gimesia chilikensis]
MIQPSSTLSSDHINSSMNPKDATEEQLLPKINSHAAPDVACGKLWSMFWYPFIMIVSQFSTRVLPFAGMADQKPDLKPGLFTSSPEQVSDSAICAVEPSGRSLTAPDTVSSEIQHPN